MLIIGAGLAGLIAAHAFQKAIIYERNALDTVSHQALLRFRSPAVGEFVGIPFRKVRVHKGIYHDHAFVAPSIRYANWYAQKCTGKLIGERSIWNLEPVDRYIAPENFISRLIEQCGSRIIWDTEIDDNYIFQNELDRIISTIPMSVMCDLCPQQVPRDPPHFLHSQIAVQRWRIPGADVFQTIYYPSLNTEVYRASMTGDILIIEAIGNKIEPAQVEYVKRSFGLLHDEEQLLSRASQRFGKIVPIEDGWRKQFMFNLTAQRNIFSLGRFATWRNILLDDVLHDIAVIKQLMNVSKYDLRRAAR